MDLITKERDRLLQRAGQVYGLCFTVVSLLCLVIPGSVDQLALLVSLPLYVLLGIAQLRVGSSPSLVWVIVVVAAGAAILVIVATVGERAPGQGALAAMLQLAAAAIPSVALVLTSSALRVAILAVSALAVGAAATLLLAPLQQPLRTLGILAIGWAVPTAVAIWISAGVPQVARRISSIGRAHRAERQASELEAQRRQGARLLHDTVLATLTLLAHSGVGVSADALRQQAADDARLLRQLRLGGSPTPEGAPVQDAATPVDESQLGTTLESVKQRFGRMGLEVSWHGTGQVLLPSHVLDAFLLALAECLENVRRHSGVTQAHVTITEDDTTVRALVTDSGVGFDINDVDEAKLGFAESVVARLRDVDGNARLFSAPGSGTTVVLEVPR
ncbi:sensor histidine kinase [Homoserinibacter sp. YIM 151385]|uniref:sensor histidine kinase n=1 Tax=Homoserinibacter sp. YIM 151385 TaxID=2985506 RepID=UPI0022F10878|nr:ATP-binding protein [Homoserinibacter sp. YIM 151385]WBU38242.1 histidine kinase [Homoserinibacter sp. YIM 151385]